ncbi:cytochrome P450 CYP6Z2 protein [Anopheles sinensis]|uniref:Cytochrome P450 CYP6Z2 protein n=1 Tax=Anopheles sinensis TaxID=74873 RepID=A0A084W4I0_ANOSI|nr:cytochrome P450 CYP6Z2 protein [Anopheles sinensis]
MTQTHTILSELDHVIASGVLVAKIGIILLLSKYNFRPSIPAKVKFAAATVPLAPEGGLPMKVERRN